MKDIGSKLLKTALSAVLAAAFALSAGTVGALRYKNSRQSHPAI